MPVAEAVDLTPRGRNEKGPDGKSMDWVKRHDQYEDKSVAKSCCEAHA